MPVIDVHQHLWPEPFVEALARRAEPPRLRGSRLALVRAEEREIDLRANHLGTRLALLDRHEIDVAVVSLSPLVGVQDLPEDDATELLDAYERGMRDLTAAAGGRIVALSAGSPPPGFPGACVDARRLDDLDALAPFLEDLVARRAFLFVHPGPAAASRRKPGWWSPVVDYTAQLQAAYAAWLAEGAARWPDLEVVFAFLAGGGPFQLERLRSWGVAGRDVLHQNVFFETSSYGNRALELCLATFGVDQLVFGSDAPVLDPGPAMDAVRGFGDAVVDALCNRNPSRLLA